MRHRPPRSSAEVARCAWMLALCAACAGGPEHAVLEQFFTASRLRDFTALEKVSTVIFEPRQDGTVLAWEIVSIRQTAHDQEEVLVAATVRLPSGVTERKPLLVTLKRVKQGWSVASVRVSTESARTRRRAPRQSSP